MVQVLEHYGVLDTFKRTGSRWSGPCPIHGGTNPSQFRVDTEKNLWNCFSECQHGGNVLDFIAKKEDVSIHAAAIKACEWFNIPLEEVKTSGRSAPDQEEPAVTRASKPKPAPAPAAKPDDNTPNPSLKFKLEKLDRAHPYFAERGLSQETVSAFGLGYFTGDKGLMIGRIVIPIHNIKGEVVAYAGRWPGEPTEGTPKYKFPAGFRKGLEVFNLDRAIKEDPDCPLIIVEGFFDCMKLWQHGLKRVVALMGSTLSPAQEELIVRHTNCESRIVLMLDEDDAGRAGCEQALQCLAPKAFVKAFRFPKEGQQPDQLSAEEIHELLTPLH